MALRQLSPLDKNQWKFVEKQLRQAPSAKQRKIVEDLIKTGKKVRS